MKHLSDTDKYYEVRGTLEFILRALRQAYNHGIFDSVRGASKFIASNSTSQELTVSGVSSFDSNGFTLGSDLGGNASSASMIGWTWKAGSSTVTNNDGTVSSQVRTNQTAGISICTWTYNGANTVGHGLGAVPKLMLIKGRSATYNWDVYHHVVGPTKRLLLNSTTTPQTLSGPFNNTAPTSTVFSQGAGWYSNGDNIVGYIFAEVPGFSAFGSYTANNSSNGPFAYTGFKPAFVLIKNISAEAYWMMYDNARDTFNLSNKKLAANDVLEENNTSNLGDSSLGIDMVSNGFKLRTAGANHNNSTNQYVYAAFAENPFKYALAR